MVTVVENSNPVSKLYELVVCVDKLHSVIPLELNDWVLVVEKLDCTVFKLVVTVLICITFGKTNAPLHWAGKLDTGPTTVCVSETKGSLGSAPLGYQSRAA